jgi:hypothetical protein
MTDLEAVREMLKRLQAQKPHVQVDETQRRTGVLIEAGGQAGYGGFVAALEFDLEGNLSDVGGFE